MYSFRLLVFKTCQEAIIRFWWETMEEEEISLGEIFAIIKVRLLLIISLGILGLLVSALYTFFPGDTDVRLHHATVGEPDFRQRQ